MRIKKQSMEYSREIGYFTLEDHRNPESLDVVASKMAEHNGIEYQEDASDEGWVSLSYNKNQWDWEAIVEIYKAAK